MEEEVKTQEPVIEEPKEEPKEETRPVGRPTVMTPEVIAKLVEVFSIGGTDREACLIADISTDALYDYCRENPNFAIRKEELKDMPKYTARKNIVRKINDGDVTVSQWYAERKAKDEFSVRTEQTGKDGKDLVPQPEISDEQYNRIIRARAEKLNN